jgi:hypothetical protein
MTAQPLGSPYANAHDQVRVTHDNEVWCYGGSDGWRFDTERTRLLRRMIEAQRSPVVEFRRKLKSRLLGLLRPLRQNLVLASFNPKGPLLNR